MNGDKLLTEKVFQVRSETRQFFGKLAGDYPLVEMHSTQA
jgi:hypothetical protein